MQTTKKKFNILRSNELWNFSNDFLKSLNQNSSVEYSIAYKEINLAEIITESFHMIDFSWTVFKQLSPILHRADALIQQLNWADSGLIVGNQIRPLMLSEKVFSEILSEKNAIVNRHFCASIVGDLSTLASFVNLFQRVGYKKINFYCDRKQVEEAKVFSKTAERLFINLKIDVKAFEDLTHGEELSSLLIVDIDLDVEVDLFENLSYFNFLSPKSIFMDFRNDNNNLLKLEAEKAELVVLDGRDFFLRKYRFAQQIVENP